jgi:hypothetical protein
MTGRRIAAVMKALRAAGAAGAVCLLAASASAQNAPLPGRVEIGGGVRRSGPVKFGTADANQTLPDGGTTPLFETDTELEAGMAYEARVGFPVSASVQIDLAASWGQSDLSTRISDDSEDFADVTASETITQAAFEAAVTVHLSGYRLGASAVPFVSAGVGYLRELHEDRTLVETGRFAHAGGGISVLLATRATGVKAIGIRADARAIIRMGGVALNDDARVAPSFGASLFVRF